MGVGDVFVVDTAVRVQDEVCGCAGVSYILQGADGQLYEI